MTEAQKLRYNRQIVLNGFGETGQQKLLQSKVLVVGLGGLGSVISQYLVAAGFGTVGIMDGDEVNIHNLQRQILYREDNVGKNKVDIAAESLKRLNSDVNIIAHKEFLTKDNSNRIIEYYDIVMDACDNFSTRYIISDACVRLSKPFVYGAIGDFSGQMCVFNYGKHSANYRTLFGDEKSLLEQKNEKKGVLGALPGVVASLQVNEAIKIITEMGEVMKDTLFTIDMLTLETHKYKISF